ncbi:hypothetical protein [Clostridium sp. UBA2485]|uniref:hypothetical protein n=1 Tax=Clostridium sp. UBA2485 TaxID=1946352 RepID=UPI0025B9725A|nr:hypothetical protein [Clostridium sp. UBA2485]
MSKCTATISMGKISERIMARIKPTRIGTLYDGDGVVLQDLRYTLEGKDGEKSITINTNKRLEIDEVMTALEQLTSLYGVACFERGITRLENGTFIITNR